MHSYDIPKHSTAILGGLILLIWYAATLLQRKWRQNCFVRENQCKPPSQLPSKLLGLDIILQTIAAAKQRRVLELGLSRFQHYGNTLKFRNLTKTMITTREPQNIKTILSLRFKDYSLGDRIQTFGPLLGHGIFTTDGEHWAQSRSMVRSGFSKDRIAHLDIFEELMGDLFELIPTDGSTVDLQDLFFCYTMDSATDFLFGHSVRALKKYGHNPGDETGQDFGSAFNYAQDSIATRVRMGPLKFLHRDRKAQDANRRCHELAEEFVDKALSYRQTLNENGSAGDDTSAEKSKSLFLHKLAQQTGDRTRIRDELMNVLLAGRDTTASLLSNMFFVLAKKPEIWAKLQGEIAILEGRAPTYDQLRNLTYLKYCMNECRLYLSGLFIFKY
jgi:cytochrome P450